MFPSNWYQHRWEPDYKVFQSYDPTIFVHRNNCSNFILKPYCRKITDLVNLNFCSLVTCAPKESHNVKGVAALPFFGFPPLCYSRRMKAWLPFSAFRPLFYAFSILSPFVILGVFSSPLLFLEDKDCLPFFIGLKKFLLLQRGTRDTQKVVFRAASGGCHDPQYERRGSEEAHRPWMFGHFNLNLAIWPIEPPLPLNLYLPSSVIQNKTWRLRVALPALWLIIIQFEARRGGIKVETRSHFLFAQTSRDCKWLI